MSEYKCPKCKRVGMMQVARDKASLDFIHCHACGAIYYKHNIEKMLGLNIRSEKSIKNHASHGSITNNIRSLISNDQTRVHAGFTIKWIIKELGYPDKSVRNSLAGLLKNNEIHKDPHQSLFFVMDLKKAA